MPVKRDAILLALAATLALACFGVQAQPYPSKPIRTVVPYPAGGYYDLIARVVGQKLGESLGQPIVVENRAGANGIIGTEFTARSAPDGHTIMVGGIGPHGINPGLYAKLPYDPVRDFEPVILVSVAPNILVVHASVAASSVQELIAIARARPGQLNYASNGSGSAPHLAGEMFAGMSGTRLNHVPFKGSAPALTSMLGGQTEVHFGNASDVMPHIRSGKLRALAVTGPRRVSALADTPTMMEAGLPNYEYVAWFAYFAPAATPREIILRLNADIGRILQLQDVRERLSGQGSVEVVGGTPEQLAGYVGSEIAKWSKVVRDSGAKAD